MLLAERSSEVRSHWAKFVDDVIHNEPKFVQRNERDVFMSLNLEFVEILVGGIKYNVILEQEDDEFFGMIEGFWFVENGNNEEEVMVKLAESLKDFAIDYYKDIRVYRNTPDFKEMFPMITKALVAENIEGIIDSFNVQFKKS